MNSNTKDAAMRRNPEPQPYGPQEVSFGLAELAIFVTCLEARDQNGVRTVVYLRDREKVVSLDTCTDADLLAAAVDHLTRERDDISRTLEKAKKKLSGATNTEQLKQTQRSN